MIGIMLFVFLNLELMVTCTPITDLKYYDPDALTTKSLMRCPRAGVPASRQVYVALPSLWVLEEPYGRSVHRLAHRIHQSAAPIQLPFCLGMWCARCQLNYCRRQFGILH